MERKIIILGEAHVGSNTEALAFDTVGEITEFELGRLCGESATAVAELAAGAKGLVRDIDHNIQLLAGSSRRGDINIYAESDTGYNAILELYAEAVFGSNGGIKKLWDKLVAAFVAIKNMILGFFKKFTSNSKKYRAIISRIQAAIRDVAKYSFADKAKFDVIEHKFKDGITIGKALLDTKKYMSANLSAGGDEASFDALFKQIETMIGSFEKGTVGYGSGDEAKSGSAEDVRKQATGITSKIGANAEQSTYDKFIQIILKQESGLDIALKEVGNIKDMNEHLTKEIFKTSNDKKRVMPADAAKLLSEAFGSEASAMDDLLRTISDGIKKFTEIVDDFKSAGNRLNNLADSAKDKTVKGDDGASVGEGGQISADLKGKAGEITAALTNFSTLVAILNGSLNRGYTIGAGLVSQTMMEGEKVAASIENAIKQHGSKSGE